MKTFIAALLMLTTLTISCNTNTPVIIERTKGSVEPVVNSELIKLEADGQVVDSELIKPEAVNYSCKVYEENNFRTEFTCLYFEKEFSYDEYVKQANSVNDCDKFYNDIKNKNDSICKKYKCSEEELKEHCVELFSYEDDTFNKKQDCIELKCNRNKFRSLCDDYATTCVEVVILGCLDKSNMVATDFNINSCIASNKSLIQKECTIEACITDEVKTCADIECKLEPTEKYISQCKEKERDICTTQIRTRLF